MERLTPRNIQSALRPIFLSVQGNFIPAARKTSHLQHLLDCICRRDQPNRTAVHGKFDSNCQGVKEEKRRIKAGIMSRKLERNREGSLNRRLLLCIFIFPPNKTESLVGSQKWSFYPVPSDKVFSVAIILSLPLIGPKLTALISADETLPRARAPRPVPDQNRVSAPPTATPGNITYCPGKLQHMMKCFRPSTEWQRRSY